MIKTHKYWSMGAFACMLMTMTSGHNMKSAKVHRYWAMGAFGCMAMSMYTGYKMVHRKKKKPAIRTPEEDVKKEAQKETVQNG